MGILNDTLPPNVYIIGSPQHNDGVMRGLNALRIIRGGLNTVTGSSAFGAHSLGSALFIAGLDEVGGAMMHWCQIDLNNYTIGIDGSEMRPLSEIRYAEIREPTTLIFGFDDKHWMGVMHESVSVHQKNLLKYIMQFTSLPADYYTIDPSVVHLENISKSHVFAWMDYYFRE
ncbi:hypothetical protein [Salinibacterium sp. PAMC 21357]|uniref:hypothetical protein n=1 Tax=Salinibacterium sp. PAMC 21357 TaxID=1112215 RepID=UPI000287D834|nr:hypothetical protein [Salinibacterium sp. PAMC 21357]